ncbi:MAG: GPW/gp25 family protein, partial [Mediterranea sp.]|nr:GPW/gp25 family protein [Mediterranea sp.]
MADKTTFLGNGWNFPPRFDDEKQAIATVSNEENVRQSLWTLLSTTPGERVHRYNYGCHIRQYAFEQMSVTTQTLLRDEIERAVILFEPRVRTDAVTFRI